MKKLLLGTLALTMAFSTVVAADDTGATYETTNYDSKELQDIFEVYDNHTPTEDGMLLAPAPTSDALDVTDYVPAQDGVVIDTGEGYQDIMPVNIGYENTSVDLTELQSIFSIEETNNHVLSYIPKAKADGVTISKSSDAYVNTFSNPLNSWEVSYTRNNGDVVSFGNIEEYSKASIGEVDLSNQTYVETDNYIYIANSQNAVGDNNLLTFLSPYGLDTSVAIQGINSDFALSLPSDVTLLAYNLDEYNDAYTDYISFVFQPMNMMDMPQEIFELVVSDTNPGDGFVQVLDGSNDIYVKVNTENNIRVEMDSTRYDEYVEFLTENDYANIKNNLQEPQISQPQKQNNDVVINGENTDIDYKVVSEGRKIIPLRDTFEALGYDVIWNGETKSIDLINGAVSTTVKVGEDSYHFARMADISLGYAPTIIDGTTYVPVEMLSNVLPYTVSYSDNGVMSISE
ncbi:MAG: copper amine oxidase N-terminal domain-containing protein [Lachnospirales bacterium]